ncbi:NfeD family protein [Microbacterium immunditiarum]|uniref:Membrane-bound ClpP family serine protease n=1 Tax=Microbacterium immunditiarum TaxID=337480 RepID=A0A7Y9GKN7_9MICO|nr:NfeD family protein [Microbacterium immunditiarum]NYE18194.1 membrane-bound ClpP family serine protease [Microbacterium immunditiarum]
MELTPFIVIGGIGLLVLVISLLVGDIFDHFEIGDGAISGTALGVAAVVFGASGVLTTTAGLDLVWAYVLAGVLALLAYLLAVFFVRRLTKSSDGVPVSAIGLTGVTRSTVSPAGGEVSLDGPHEVERRFAFADDTIAEGVRIRVVEHTGTRVKVVAD